MTMDKWDRIDEGFYPYLFWSIWLLTKSRNKILRMALFIPVLIILIGTTLLPVGLAYMTFCVIRSIWEFGNTEK